jgi:hypothetical protein
MRRSLALSRETLAELTAADLAAVDGGAAATGGCPRSIHVDECLSLLIAPCPA